MTNNVKLLLVGSAIGAIVGITAGYGMAKMVESGGLSVEGAPTDVKTAWDAYVVAQRNYMEAAC